MKGGKSLETQEQRINWALSESYTPLINAIINEDSDLVGTLLENGADPNEVDSTFGWCPLKWASFVFYYKNTHNMNEFLSTQRKLIMKRARTCYDIGHTREDEYNFSPIILDVEEALQRMRNEIEEDEIDRRTEGGKRVKKSRKTRKSIKRSKSRKNMRKKSYRK